jgi:hypothetical protein
LGNCSRQNEETAERHKQLNELLTRMLEVLNPNTVVSLEPIKVEDLF